MLSAVRQRNEKKKREEARAHAEYLSRNNSVHSLGSRENGQQRSSVGGGSRPHSAMERPRSSAPGIQMKDVPNLNLGGVKATNS